MRDDNTCSKCREMDGFQPLYDPELCEDCPDVAEAEAIERELKSDNADEEE